MRRRDFLSLVTALVSAELAAQPQPAKLYRIGWLSTAPPDAEIWAAFVEGLRERGWIEGKNIAVEALYSEGRNDRFPALAAELVKRNVDVIVASGTPPAEAARDSTTSIPIVFVFVGDPVGAGLVDSYARPGRNLTGLGGFAVGFYTKQLALLKEVVPKASRIGMLMNDTFSLHIAMKGELEVAARKLGVTLVPVPVRVPEDIDTAFATLANARVDALFIGGQPLIGAQRARVVKLALEHRMPAVSPFDFVTKEGLLMSYASRFIDDVRRAPHFSIGSSGVRNLGSCRWSSRLAFISPSISGPLRRSALQSRRRCSPRPIRYSSDGAHVCSRSANPAIRLYSSDSALSSSCVM